MNNTYSERPGNVFTENRSILASYGFAMITVLASSDMILGISVGITALLSMTAAVFLTSLLSKYTGNFGSRSIYIVSSAFVCAMAALIFSKIFPHRGYVETFSFVAVLLPVCGVSTEIYTESEKNERTRISVLRALTVGAMLFAALLVFSFIREFLGKGSLIGIVIMEAKLPLLTHFSGGCILYGMILAVSRGVFKNFSSKKIKKLKKIKINTEADDADC